MIFHIIYVMIIPNNNISTIIDVGLCGSDTHTHTQRERERGGFISAKHATKSRLKVQTGSGCNFTLDLLFTIRNHHQI